MGVPTSQEKIASSAASSDAQEHDCDDKDLTATGLAVSRLRSDFGTDRVLGHVGGGLEYRFTPHIGIFGEIAYVFPNLSNNNFIQTNFGLRFAFQAEN